jgi:GntR family transcriptional regulator, rspAB operon transcriptional repressor
MPSSGTTYQQVAYEYIKSQITTLNYKPGEILNDSLVAKALSISRTPVREAFCRLENEGLLISEPRRGWRVHTLTLKDIEEIFALKIIIEGMMARCAAACTDESLRAQLRQSLSNMQDTARSNDIDAWLKADAQFHQIIAAMADNQRAHRFIDNLNNQWHRVHIGFVALQGRVHQSLPEHQSIAQHILAEDGPAAEDAMQRHLQSVCDALVNLLENIVLPFSSTGV